MWWAPVAGFSLGVALFAWGYWSGIRAACREMAQEDVHFLRFDFTNGDEPLIIQQGEDDGESKPTLH